MKILHRISFDSKASDKLELTRLGVEFEMVGVDGVVFVIDESSRAWPHVAARLSEWNALDIPTTRFSRKELQKANYVRMGPAWHCGYPQPEDRYEFETYDNCSTCSLCKIGRRQRSPFRMLREPKWGTRSILQLNWVFDEFFVTPSAWQIVFEPFGIKCIPVLRHNNGQPLETVVQLDICENVTSHINPNNAFEKETCCKCGQIRLLGVSVGYFPFVELPENVAAAKTLDYFGSTSWQEIIISATLFEAIVESGLKGAAFDAVSDHY